MAEDLLRKSQPPGRPERRPRGNSAHHSPLTSAARHQISLTDNVQFLHGVGPRKAELLQRLGIRTVGDLLDFFPTRYEKEEARSVIHLDEGMIATVIGRIEAVRMRYGRRGPTVAATLIDNTGRCGLKWFNAAWMTDRVQRGMIVRATGKVGAYGDRPELMNPRLVVLDESAPPADESAPPRFASVYSATSDLSSKWIGELIRANLDALVDQIKDWHDPAYLRERGLVARNWAVKVLHRPANEADLNKARRRLCYDELLGLQLAVSIAREQRRSRKSSSTFKVTSEIDQRIRRRFGFQLTPAQDRAITEIVGDLARPCPMHRLLQGDVGCGKTVVALYAALVTIAGASQVAIMAPTEILAQQHHRGISKFLAESRVRIALLTGGMPPRDRRDTLSRIERGDVDLVIGTHALLQENVHFARLGLVVVDEQHRFGVRQRATIRSKGPAPHYLIMTATPIPRTLTMTVFGDLDVSTIDALPPGRAPVATRLVKPTDHDRAWQDIRALIQKGQQAFVVYPLIDESDRVEARAATTEFRRLRERVFSGHTIALLHGRMPTAEREQVMNDFAAGRVSVLVATTVIEVGIDVPNATCMVIEHPERFGLSQLHQLRGRIGRGTAPGLCLLMAANENAADNERLTALVRTTDGFRIAEEDLRLRGPGEMLGTRQHGLPELHMADLLRDGDILRMAQRDAGQFIRRDPNLSRPDNVGLRNRMQQKYQESFKLLLTG